MPDERTGLVHASGECEIDLARRELRVSGAFVPVGGRAFQIIEVLADSAGELVTKNELLDRIWPGAIVGENTLHVHAGAIRKALGPYRNLLKTESGRGYRLLGDWTVRPQETAKPPVGLQRMRTDGQSPLTNFPAPVTQLIGRTAAVTRVRDLMSAYRVVTLTGPGGIGKTSLAVKAARGVAGEYADGAWLVELASLSDPALVPSAVAQVLRLGLGGGDINAEAIAHAISDRHLLLVLDNCEHLIDAVANLVEMLPRHCPHLTILTTSREILRTQGEYVYRVPPLVVPAPEENEANEILGHSAPELFIARARELGSDFSSGVTNLVMIATICRRLDGIPLAIEFAAACATTLGLELVATSLHDRLALLTSGRRTALPRHQTLRAALDWSYHLLPEGEQRLLRQLSVFPAGFTLDAAAAVMRGPASDAPTVTEGIANLVAKSLVTVSNVTGVSRWYLLETVRAYAQEKLVRQGERDSAESNHASYFRDLFADLTRGSSTRLSDLEWTHRVREIDNVRSAIGWCFSGAGNSSVGVGLTAAYAPVWLHLSLMQECRDRCARALDRLDLKSASHARFQIWLRIALAAALFDTMGSARHARDLLISAVEAAEALGDFDAQAAGLAGLNSNYIFQTECGKAWGVAERLARVASRMGDAPSARIADRLMGTSLIMLGRPHEAEKFLLKFLEPRPSGDQARPLWFPSNHPATARTFLALSLWLRGYFDKAHSEAQASIEELHATDHPLLLCRLLYFGLCRIALGTGDLATARQSIARLIEAATRLNGPFWRTAGSLLSGALMIERREFRQGVTVLREALATCRRTGWRMSYVEFNAALAAGLAWLGELDEALQAVNDALAAGNHDDGGHDLYFAEAMRIKGEILSRRQATEDAEACFLEALDIAHKQEALLWELRAALGLARLRIARGRDIAGREILLPVYKRFPEGFDTADLRLAAELLRSPPDPHPN